MRIALALLVALLPATVFGAAPEARHHATRSGLQFFTGNILRISEVSTDSIFAAGGTVDVRGGAPDHIFAVGRFVRLIDTGVQDAFLAGREIAISGAVRDDILAAGERVEADPTATVGGDAIYAGRLVRIAGATKGDVIAVGARIELAGDIEGDVNLTSPDIVLSPGLKIGGALNYRSPTLLAMPKGVTIAGGLNRRPWPDQDAPRPGVEAGEVVAGAILGAVAFSLFAAAVLFAAPRAIETAVRQIQDARWTSLGIGLATVIALPTAAVIACLTVIGLPLGLFLLVAGAVGFGVAAVVGWTWLGMQILALVKGAPRTTMGARIFSAGIGVSVFVAVGLVPILGVLAQAFVILAGYGAVVIALHPSRRNTSPEAARAVTA